MLKMIIIRGLPGSGKSTLAKEMLENARAADEWLRHFEADQYFVQAPLGYVYKPDLKSVAHKWCQSAVETALLGGSSVIVSNTFTTYSEMIPYLILAREFGARIEIITCRGTYPNVHNVPEDVIQRMRDRWED